MPKLIMQVHNLLHHITYETRSEAEATMANIAKACMQGSETMNANGVMINPQVINYMRVGQYDRTELGKRPTGSREANAGQRKESITD